MNTKTSTSNLLVVGSVAFDSIKTPFGKADKALGGSGTYFSLAASYFTVPSLVAVVGEDFGTPQKQILKKRRVDISGLENAKGKSFAWGGEYSFDLNNRTTLFTHLNVFENFQPKLLSHHRESKFIFLGNIHPKLQLDVLAQLKKPKLIGLDTMNFWIEKSQKDLVKVLKLVDIFIINDSEARQFSGQHNLIKASKKILGLMGKPATRTLIIKRGEYGLLMFHQNKIFHLPGYPLEDVIDPTGAGDSFAGGFMGYLAKTDNLNFDNLKRACVYGSVLASFCVEKLGTLALQNLSPAKIAVRCKKFKELTHFEAI
jgi:sugar/nucleoside kinase (ribokinase family)